MKWLKKGQLPSKVKEIIVSKVGKDKNGRDKSIVIYCKKKGVGKDKNGRDKSIVIYCKKKGVCSSDRKLVRGQNIFVRGDVNASIRKICTDVSRAIVECTI